MTTKFMMSAAYGTPMLEKTVTKGLSSRPAFSYGMVAAMTTIAPMKKITRRSTVVRMALGMFRAGSVVSPAATPISSEPENAKKTTRTVTITPVKPFGNRPADVEKFSNSCG